MPLCCIALASCKLGHQSRGVARRAAAPAGDTCGAPSAAPTDKPTRLAPPQAAFPHSNDPTIRQPCLTLVRRTLGAGLRPLGMSSPATAPRSRSPKSALKTECTVPLIRVPCCCGTWRLLLLCPPRSQGDQGRVPRDPHAALAPQIPAPAASGGSPGATSARTSKACADTRRQPAPPLSQGQRQGAQPRQAAAGGGRPG